MKHRGIRHLHLVVADLERSVRFYTQAFGMKELHRRPQMVFMQTPGVPEILTLKEEASDRVGKCGGIDHFGIPLDDPSELEAAIDEVVRAGGTLLEKATLEGGIPTAFVGDPDGYRIQI